MGRSQLRELEVFLSPSRAVKSLHAVQGVITSTCHVQNHYLGCCVEDEGEVQ